MSNNNAQRWSNISRVKTVAFAAVLASSTATYAAISTSQPAGAAGGTNNPQVVRLVHDAQESLRAGRIELAILQLKNAVVLQPHNGMVRAQLGMVLLAHGEAVAAELQLTNAKADGAPLSVVAPPLMELMLSQNEAKQLLQMFPDPGPNANGSTAAQILMGRAIAFSKQNQMTDAKATADRALAIDRSPGMLLGRAQIARADKDNALSDRLIDEALARKPNELNALLMKIESLRHQKGPKALAIANRVVSLYPNNLAAKMELILVLEDVGQGDKAMAGLNAILQGSPRMPLALYYKALFLANAHQARPAWMIAQTLPKEFLLVQPDMAIAVAGMAVGAGDLNHAGAILGALLNLHPENNRARLLLATVRIQQGAQDSAAQILAPLLEAKDPQALVLMAESSLKEKHYGEMLDFLERASSGFAGNDLMKRDLALAEMNYGKPTQGIEDMEQLAAKQPDHPEFAGPLIGALLRAKRMDDAQASINRFANAAGKSPFAGLFRAQYLVANNNLAGAVDALNQSLSIDPKFLPALFYRAVTETALGRNADAMRDIDLVLVREPANVLALVEKATLLTRSGQDRPAFQELNLAIEKAPQNPLPRRALTNLQILRKRYDDAAQTVAAWQHVLPNDSEAMAFLGQIQLLKGQKEAAVETYKRLAGNMPQSPGAQILLARAMALAGDPLGADLSAQKAISLSPDSFSVRQAAIAIELRLGKGDRAIAAAKEYQNSHAGIESDLLLADCYIASRRVDEARAILQASFARTPDNRIVMRLAQTDVMQGKSQDAIARLNSALAKAPDNVAMRRALASLLLQNGNSNAARDQYESVLRESPNDPQSLNDLAWIIQDQDPNRALALATRATEIAPSSGEIADTLGWLMYRHGNAKGASDILARAHVDSSQNGEISYHLAVVLNSLGERAQAKALLQSTLSANLGFADVSEAKKLLAVVSAAPHPAR